MHDKTLVTEEFHLEYIIELNDKQCLNFHIKINQQSTCVLCYTFETITEVKVTYGNLTLVRNNKYLLYFEK